MKRRSNEMIKILLFVVVGALAGFAYHRLVGCSTGGCPITSNPYFSTLYGAVLGYLVSGILG
ncbi:MAG: YtxH domain-containing protein [Deltaproteobacteria bacterium]|nr:YtxH domain-containing protein [Deltaproteobacteria bacterium]